MARLLDRGGYTIGNIYATTQAENTRSSNLWNPRRPKGRCKAVMTPAGVFESATAAAKAHGLLKVTGTMRARRGWKGWRYQVLEQTLFQ